MKEEKKCNRTSWGPGLQSDRINIGNGVERYAAHESAEHNSAADPGTPEPGNIIRSRESILENDWLSVQRGEIEREKRASGFFHCKDFSICILLLLAWWAKKSRSGDSFIFVRQGRRWQLPRRALWFESERFQMRLWTKREDLADGNLTKEEKNHQRRHPADDSNVEIQLADVRIEPWLSTERPHLATIFRRSPDWSAAWLWRNDRFLPMVYLFMFAPLDWELINGTNPIWRSTIHRIARAERINWIYVTL